MLSPISLQSEGPITSIHEPPRPKRIQISRQRRRIEALENARTAIEASLGDDVPMAMFAKVAGFHPDTFARLFRTQYGVTPVTYRMRARLERAARDLAENPKKSIRAVASELGFGNVSHFYREFHRHFGATPRGRAEAPAAELP